MNLEKYSIGIGDRFGCQGRSLLKAVVKGRKKGVDVIPVWNKSNREHKIIGTTHAHVRAEADEAVKAMEWMGPYHVDADHIGLDTVDQFVDHSDFFTLDVADFTGKPAQAHDIDGFVDKHKHYAGELDVDVTEQDIRTIAEKYLLAVREAGKIYRKVESAKGAGNFITEVSMDETDRPQTPVELFFILAAIAEEAIPAQTIAPRFTGRFNKGVDYVGDPEQFAVEFEQDLGVITTAVREFGLPNNLKLSVHSGSDKFSIYGHMKSAIRKYDAGLHIKTAGTTWLEELIGLAMAGGDGLDIAREVYMQAMGRFDELCEPYASVIDIDGGNLPSPDTVYEWSGEDFAAAVTHDQTCDQYNPDMRQLLHVGYRVAAEMGDKFIQALRRHEEVVAPLVTKNIYDRHLKPVFY
jgi:hypothetical protein